MHSNLMREENESTSYYGSQKPILNDNGIILFNTDIAIDRTTGEGRISHIAGDLISRDIFKCSTEKPKLLF